MKGKKGKKKQQELSVMPEKSRTGNSPTENSFLQENKNATSCEERTEKLAISKDELAVRNANRPKRTSVLTAACSIWSGSWLFKRVDKEGIKQQNANIALVSALMLTICADRLHAAPESFQGQEYYWRRQVGVALVLFALALFTFSVVSSIFILLGIEVCETKENVAMFVSRSGYAMRLPMLFFLLAISMQFMEVVLAILIMHDLWFFAISIPVILLTSYIPSQIAWVQVVRASLDVANAREVYREREKGI
eukprot:CAMPEP_0175122992 /NCGR_PEP_ID=MMETSP0087-20121206/2004_1 /TAXON_ID=136419 /ORGANISM="Unknown Unknown, Strain D1" /LENGTH=250 /DNA_ID=CAMNT_0016404651 /DNA_START=44 /DNA_END=796 /DNA_ORIENTATION=+